MSTNVKSIAAAVLAALLLPALAAGQPVPTQTGRLLDANPQIGSGGYNVSGAAAGRFNSQLYITGQVTGLRRFRGSVGYSAPNQLNLILPSASLSTFRRQSVGLRDVLGGGSYLPAPYYERTSTALNVRDITSGRVAPGTNIPRSATVSPSLARRLYVDATADYRPIAPVAPRRTIPLMPPSIAPGRQVGTTELEDIFSKPARLAARPGAGAIFHMPRAQDRQLLVRQLSKIEQRYEKIDERIDAEVKAEIDATATARTTPRRTEAQRPAEAPQSDTDKEQPPLFPAGPPAAASDLPEPNRDVYVDILVRILERRTRNSAMPDKPSAEALEDLADEAPSGTTPAKQRSVFDGDGNLVELSAKREIVIHGLAGVSPDAFNKYMAAAEKLLKAGKYYGAADKYELALIIDSGNPLARVGMALALFAAGEPLSAAVHLRHAMELFPPLMETHLDIPAMMDQADFQRRVEAVDRRLTERAGKEQDWADPLLVFVAAYMHSNAGQKEKAGLYAARLQAAAPSDKLFTAYASFVLTGRRPATQTTTKPAR